jgi:hypothetical protein
MTRAFTVGLGLGVFVGFAAFHLASHPAMAWLYAAFGFSVVNMIARITFKS